jgi:diguanylate cyclase (GGDEF)-like protein/PAS domain S-box-containing protein
MDEANTILIVDDDPNICKALAAVLSKNGYKPDVAHTGEEALDRAEQRFYNLALLDIRLSGMGGVELIGRLKELHPDMAIVMVTAYGSVETAVQAVNEGAAAYIMKPFAMDDVLTTVGQVLEKQRLVIENRELYEATRRELAGRERTEKALKEEQAFTGSMLNALADTLFVFDPSTGKALRWNRAFREISGYTDEEIASRKAPDDWYSDEDLQRAEETTREVFEEGRGTVEMSLITKEGTSVPTEYTGSLIRDAAGRPHYMIAVGRDITERKKAEEALRLKTERQARLLRVARELALSLHTDEVLGRIIKTAKEMLAASGCVLYLLDPDGRTLRPVACDQSAYQERVLAAPLDIDDCLTGQAIKACRALIFNDAATNPLGYQIPGTPEDDDERLAVAPLLLGGSVLGALCVTRLTVDFHEEDLALAQGFAAFAATAIKNARAHEALQRESEARKHAAEALEKEREHYRSFVESLTGWAWEMGTDGVHTYSNRAVEDVLGYTAEEVVGRHTSALWREEDRTPENLERLRKTLAEGKGWKGVTARFSHKDGSTRIVESTAIPVRDSENRLAGYRGIDHDITDRQRKDRELRDGRERYRLLFEGANDAVFVRRLRADGIPGKLTEANELACRRLGYSREELLSLSPADIIDPSAGTDVSAVAKRLFADGHCLFEQVQVAKDGRRIPVEVNAHLIELGGEPSILSIARDITDRKRAEEALRESEERYRATVEQSADAIFIMAVGSRRIIESNATLQRLIGRSAGEIEQLTVYDLVAHEREDIDDKIEMILRDKRAVLGTRRYRRKDGSLLEADVSVSLISYGGAEALCVSSRDVTERRREELSLQASVRFLGIANRHSEMDSLLKESLEALKEVTTCSAVGIRILGDGGSIPYQAYDGFPRAFYELENPLSIESDSCMCINVVKGETDPTKPFYTEGGSFYMNGTTRFLATVSPEEKGQTRNACNSFGYESVALVPIRLGERLLGLIHVADHRDQMVPRWMVGILEKVGLQLGTAIQRVAMQEQLAHAATHDLLTELPNRQLFAELFAKERARAQRSGESVAVMFLDLDHFKDINDTLGHTVGDELLCAVAARLSSVPRTADAIARMGGDEFVLAVPGIGQAQDATRVAERIMEAVRQPFELGGLPVRITTSLGIAFYPRDGEDLDSLLRAADRAMYRAKEEGRDRLRVHTPDPTLENHSLEPDTPTEAGRDSAPRSELESDAADDLRDTRKRPHPSPGPRHGRATGPG